MTEALPSKARRFDGSVVAIVALLMLTHALPYPWATVTLDTARDLAAAFRIVEGQTVLRGPILNGLFNLGPIWFYLLAPVLALTKSQALTLLWIGLLASTKFPLAYSLGRSIRDSELGLCFAALLALPGWSSMGSVFPTHTVMIESAVLLQLLLMYRIAHGASYRYWAWLGVASGLALHAHPSAVFVLILVPAVLWVRRGTLRSGDLLAMLIGSVLCLLPLTPMLLAEYHEGWPALAPTLDFAHHSGGRVSVSIALQILQGTLIEGPRVALELIGSTLLTSMLGTLMIVVAIRGLLGNLRRAARPERAILALALLALPVLALLLAGLRNYTPYYMTLVLIPFGCVAVGLGLRQLPKTRAWMMLALILAISGSVILISSAESGHANINVARLSNVRNAVPKPVNAALLPAWQLDGLSSAMCAANQEVTLHGYLALLYDASLALGPELLCGKRDGIALAGRGAPSSQHWLGLPPALARALGIQTGRSWTDTLKTDVQPLSPLEPVQPADRTHYPQHLASAAAATPHRWKLRSVHGRRVLITTDLLYPYRVNRVSEVWADGIPARKAAEMNVTQVWICDHCRRDQIDWEVHALSNDPDVLDIVATTLP